MSFYAIWGRMFLVFGKIFQQVRQNCTLSLYVSEGDFWVNCFFYEFFWVSALFSDCAKNILQHWRKISIKCVKTVFYLYNKFFDEHFFSEEKTYSTFFSNFDRKIWGLLSENLPTSLKLCFLHLFRGSSCITSSFSLRKFTLTNGLWGKIFVIP